MKGFLLGLLVAGLAFGAYLYVEKRKASTSPTPQVASAPDAGAPGKKRRKRGRGASRVARAPAGESAVVMAEPEPEPEPVKLSPADLKSVAQGDDLSRAEVIRMDMSKDDNLPELSQDDIDARFRAEEGAILDCIANARPDPETYVPGRVNVKFRIQRGGDVRGVRVEAPAVLQKGGLYGCIRKVVTGLRFPASSSGQIVTYPFSLS